MKEFSFLRRPTKIILYGILFFLMIAVCLIFALQYVLDGITMEHAIETYAYTGTIYSCVEEDPFYKVVPEHILEQLAQSEYVEVLDVRETYSGKADDVYQVVDGFITLYTMDNFCMLDVEVIEEEEEDISFYQIKPLTVLAGIKDDESIALIIESKDEPKRYLQQGNRVVLIARQSGRVLYFYKMSDLEGFTFYPTEPIADVKAFEQTLFFRNPYIILPDDLDEVETKQYIQSFLEETGWDKWLEKKKETECMFTVRTVSDMGLLIPFVEGKAFLTDGRELAASDIGSKVCVISEMMAETNKVNVGDTISLALADTSYVVDETYEPHQGWESGFPGEQDELLSYGEAEEYEVVGIYNTIYKDAVNDCFLYSQNDIFIPQLPDSYEAAVKTARPYEISFRILGPDYEAFMDELETVFYEQGYVVDVVDSGWENVEDAFAAIAEQTGTDVVLCSTGICSSGSSV